jgi:hypothetical protein
MDSRSRKPRSKRHHVVAPPLRQVRAGLLWDRQARTTCIWSMTTAVPRSGCDWWVEAIHELDGTDTAVNWRDYGGTGWQLSNETTPIAVFLEEAAALGRGRSHGHPLRHLSPPAMRAIGPIRRGSCRPARQLSEQPAVRAKARWRCLSAGLVSAPHITSSQARSRSWESIKLSEREPCSVKSACSPQTAGG